MERHLSRSCFSRTSPVTVISPGMSSNSLDPNFNRCLSLALLPLILPGDTSFSKTFMAQQVSQELHRSISQIPSSALSSPPPSVSLFHWSIQQSTVLSLSFSKTTSLLHAFLYSSIPNPGSRFHSHPQTKTDQIKQFSNLSRCLILSLSR